MKRRSVKNRPVDSRSTRKHSKAPLLLGTYVITAIVLCLAVPETLHAQTTAVAGSSGDAAIGRVTFTQYCSICHGVGAQGFIGPRLAGINFGRAGLQTIVRHGLGGYGGMPPFSRDSVSDRNLDDILAYLVSQGPPAVVAAAPAAGGGAAAAVAGSAGTAGGAASGGDTAHGSTLYAANCASCHGAAGQGGFGPALKNEKSRKDFTAAVSWIKKPALPMPKLYPTPLSEQDVHDVAAFVESL